MSDRLAAVLATLLALGPSAASAAAPVPDPTRPAVLPVAATAEKAPTAALVLQSTLVSPRQRSAIINGQRYRLGDTVGDARLAAIGPGWVRLQGAGGSPVELRLSYSNSTRPVNR